MLKIREAEIKEEEEEKKEILQTLNDNLTKSKNSCIGIVKDLKAIQVLAGVSTGASAVGTLTSGGALASGIVKSVKDKKIYDTDIEGKEKRLAEINTLLETKDKKMKEYNCALYGKESELYTDPTGCESLGLLSQLEFEKKTEEDKKNRFESEYQNYLSEIRYCAESRQKAIKEVPKLYEQYKAKQTEYKNCLEKLNNNEEYKKLEERDYELRDIAYQRAKEKYENNFDNKIIENTIHIEELTKEEKKEWQDIQTEKLNIGCDNLRYEEDNVLSQIKSLDNDYQIAANKLKIYSFRTYKGYKNAKNYISDISLLVRLQDNDYEFEKEVFTDVESYIKQYRETGDKFNNLDRDNSDAKYFYDFYKNSSSLVNNVQKTIDGIKTKIKEFDDLEKEKELLEKEISEYKKNEAVSNLTGNLRTGLMAGSIATSTASTITSGISAKKLDDLIEKMKDCDRTVNTLKSSVNNAVAEEIDTDLTTYQNITKSCSGFDTNNIKEIKSVMVASTIVGGVGAVAGTVGTITSAVANNKNTKENAKNTEDGRVKAKALNMTANISTGIATGTSASGIVLGAVALNKLAKNVDVAEKCEDALK